MKRRFQINKLTQPSSLNGPRVNDQIRVEKVRLIDEAGNMVGVLLTRDAIQRAQDVGLDLIEISPNAEPPVCKILDYGKYKYDLQKKKQEAKKKQKVVEIKEVKFRPVIGEHDYQTKLKHVRRFIVDDKNKVKLTLRFRGREMSHKEVGMRLFSRLQTEVEDVAKIEVPAKLEGNQITDHRLKGTIRN
mgnify:CR=1 FL=1